METLKIKIFKALLEKDSKVILEAFYKIGILPIAIDYTNFYEIYTYKFKVEKDLIRKYNLTCDNEGCFWANIQRDLIAEAEPYINDRGENYMSEPWYEYTLVNALI